MRGLLIKITWADKEFSFFSKHGEIVVKLEDKCNLEEFYLLKLTIGYYSLNYSNQKDLVYTA